MKTMIEPGPELDAKVAAACGIEGRKEYISPELGGGYYAFCVRGEPFEPSRSADHAFEAAEKVGLFNYGSLEKVGDLWRFCSSAFTTSLQSSPALAICDGVIALVESRRESDA